MYIALMSLNGPAFREHVANDLPGYAHLRQTNDPKKIKNS